MEKWELKQMQSLPLKIKIEKTKLRIREWYDHWNGDVYVSFSGGKDSTVLLDIVRQCYPDIPAVFVDTGLEYPEIREFVKTINNVIIRKPELTFKQVLDKYGYPVISKEVSRDIYYARSCPDGKTADKFIRGSDYHKKYGDRFLLEKWNFLKDSVIPISNKCCDIIKKRPMKKYQKESKKYPYIGTLASESRLRKKEYLRSGCNAFNNKNPISTPLGFWTEQDILKYIKEFNIPYASVYGKIVENEKKKLHTTGENRTGCMFCMFGCHLEKEPNKFQRMKITHPKQYDYCINKLKLGKVLEYINVPYN